VTPLTREEQVVAAVRAGHTYGEVARKFPGLTRSAVAGIAWRAKLPPRPPREAPRRLRRQSPYEMPVLVLLADGRERTTVEIAKAVGGHRDTLLRLLHRLVDDGSVLSTKLWEGSIATWVWREAPEDL
jgi:DNA-binding CsgD family transcriptional regulator